MEIEKKATELIMSIAIIVPKITNRMRYTFDWLFLDQLGIEYQVFTEVPVRKDFLLVIGYGIIGTGFDLPAEKIFFEHDIVAQKIAFGAWEELPVLFYNNEEHYTVPFDIFAAIFYLLSRYEEYLPHQTDKHNRYPAKESVLYKQQLLGRPIIDEWVKKFAEKLEEKGIVTKKKSFQFLPTYDIDIAWKFKHKSLKQSIGSMFKDLVNFRFTAISERMQVLFFQKNDPYDTFDWISNLENRKIEKPIIFILAASENTAFDKNILPVKMPMKNLIKRLGKENFIGIHPSFYSDVQADKLIDEKILLEKTIQKPIQISRQHYIKNKIPTCYRQLIAADIKEDYSMGYGTDLGFRAGTSHSFYWFDLENNNTTNLKIHPFCFMDTTAHFELKLWPTEAFEQLNSIAKKVKNTNGKLITIFHNSSLGSDKQWRDWAAFYQSFYQSII